MKHLIVGFAVAALCAVVPSLFGQTTTYYVDETAAGASDANSGSANAPWLTVGKCASTLSPGDTCVVKNTAATYSGFTETTSGSAGNRITYQCAGPLPSFTSDIRLNNNVDYVTIRDCQVRGIQTASTTSRNDWIQIMDNRFRNTSTPIYLLGDENLVSGNDFDHSVTGDVFFVVGQHNVIRNNTSATDDSGGNHDDFIQTYCEPLSSSGDVLNHSLIENNQVTDMTHADSHFYLTNDNNTCNVGPVGTIIRYNKVRGMGDIAMYVNDSGAADDNSDVSIYNNTVMDGTSQMYGLLCFCDAADSSQGINNLTEDYFSGNNAISGFDWGSGGAQRYNLYYDSTRTLTFSGQASNEIGAVKNKAPLMTDPDNNDFTLTSTSPAIDAGGSLTTVAAADGGSGTTLILTTTEFFQDGWAGVDADCIAVGSVSNTACIASIDNATRITLDAPISRTGGDDVWLYSDSDRTVVLKGAAPDIGAEESQGGFGVPDQIPPTVTITAPTS